MRKRQRRRALPYISPAEREQANWRTLPEAVADVVRVDGCQPENARGQIGNALASGDLWPLRWEDWRPSPSGPTGGATISSDVPPRKWSKAEIAEIDWEGGTAVDRSEFSPAEGRRRRLLIHRLRIAQWWPEPNRTRGKPGPKPGLRAGIAKKMLADLLSGRRTADQLKGDTLLALVAQYGGSQNTANAARQDALSQFSELSNSRQNNFEQP
jgi:hypothetical protein